MPKDKDRALNPAAAHRKAEKQRALKKGRATVTAQRNERLAHRNPDRLQRQIDELKELQESRGGELSQRDKETLTNLERDVARIRKAKEAVGDGNSTAPARAGEHREGHRREGERRGGGRDDDGRRNGQGQVLGKRGRGHDRYENRHRSRSVSSATDDDVRDIPMPRDTPPPIPSQRRNRGPQRQRPHWQDEKNRHGQEGGVHAGEGRGEEQGQRRPHGLPPKPGGGIPQRAPVQSQKVYESKPVLRDLQREAAAAFVPNVVKKKLDAARGGVDQPLLEEEELERLEREGYVKRSAAGADGGGGGGGGGGGRQTAGTANPPGEKAGIARIPEDKAGQPDGDVEDEMTRFSRDVRNVQIEEVEDEDA